MVIVITLAGKFIKEKTAFSGQSNGTKPAFNSVSDNGQVTAAISAAVNEYRKSS
ncbi:MAG: OadG family protein [Spirochaetes bacterium]|nr:OadG family protein [Spirochaetota bacterium]